MVIQVIEPGGFVSRVDRGYASLIITSSVSQGVPEMAIKQKMSIEGLDPNILE